MVMWKFWFESEEIDKLWRFQGEKMAEPDEADGNEQPHIDEDLGAEPEDMAPPPPHLSERAEQASLQAMPPTPAFAPIAGAGQF